MNTSPFFILGCQRSGTTLLRLMLNAHSEIAIPEEGGFWMPFLRRFRKDIKQELKGVRRENYLRFIEKNTQFQLWDMDPEPTIKKLKHREYSTLTDVMTEFYADYAASFGKKIWGDKTPSFFRMVPELARLFPEARFIHIVRDGRDVFLSWQKMNVRQRNSSVGALEWAHKAKKVKEMLDQVAPGNYFETRYEDLVEEPEQTLMQICEFLKIPFENGMLNYWKTSNQFIGGHHSEQIKKPVTTNSVGKWRENLPTSELKKFESVAASTLKQFGYELTTKISKQPVISPRIIFELAYGIPIRYWSVYTTALKSKIGSWFGLKIDTAEIISTYKEKSKKK